MFEWKTDVKEKQKLKKNTLWSIFWDSPRQISKEGVGESEFLAVIAMATNHGNLKKDVAPNIQVFSTDVSLERFRLTRIPAFELNSFLSKLMLVGENVRLTLSWRRPLSYRKQTIDLLHKSMDWFLYDNGLRHERVN